MTDLLYPAEPEFEDWTPPAEPKEYFEAGFDIETVGLNADYGVILCVCIKPMEKPTITFRLDDFEDRGDDFDKEMLIEVTNTLNQCARLYGWNSTRYDCNWLRGRRLTVGLSNMACSFRHTDLLYPARRLGYHDAKLETLMRQFSRTEKYDVRPAEWLKAFRGNKASMDRIVRHCQQDVAGMEDVYKYLFPQVAGWTQVVI